MSILRVTVLLIVGLSHAAVAVSDELPTLDQVRGRLEYWRKNLVAFRFRYESRSPRTDFARVRELVLTDRHHYLYSGEVLDPSEPSTRVVSGGNDRERFVGSYKGTADRKAWTLSGLNLEPRTSTTIGSGYVFTPLYLLLHPHSGLWMDEYYFADNKLRITGREVVDGESCIVVDVEYYDKGKVDGNGSTLWLAEEKDFLIKKVQPKPGPPTGYLDMDYVCTEFRKVDGQWFPFRGTNLLPPEQYNWNVLSLEVNPTLSPQIFAAPSPAGLIRKRSSAGPTPETAVGKAPPAGSAPPSARATHSMTPLLVIGLLIVAVGCLFTYQRAKR